MRVWLWWRGREKEGKGSRKVIREREDGGEM